MDDRMYRKLAVEWAKTEMLLSEPLRARIQEYHTEGVKALLEFHDNVGLMLQEEE